MPRKRVTPAEPRSTLAGSVERVLALRLPLEPTSPVVYGANVAATSFVDAVLRHSRFGSPHLVYGDGGAPYAKELLRASRAHGGVSQAQLLSARAMVRADPTFNVSAWHEVRPRDDIAATYLQRELRPQIYPITVTQYALSYSAYLHRFFLPLLLSRTRACDALVLLSAAAERAARRILDTVSDRFAGEFGVRLAFNGETIAIPSGVDVASFRTVTRTDARRLIGVPDDAFMILWFGRIAFDTKADLRPLVVTMARLVAANPGRNLLLVLVGRSIGGDGSACEAAARELGIGENVRLETPDARVSRTAWYRAADVFVSPADNVEESFGLTPVEAMAAGVPQVVADWNGYRETVVNGTTGFLVPSRWSDIDGLIDIETEVLGDSSQVHLVLGQTVAIDLEAMQAAIQTLIDNPRLRREMSAESLARSDNLYDWPQIIRQYDSLWEELAAKALREKVAPPRSSYLRPDYHATFAHYPTTLLSNASIVRLTREGERLASGIDVIEDDPRFAVFLTGSVASLIASTLMQLSQDGSGCAVDLILKRVTSDGRISETAFRRHIMWMAKQGFVAFIR